MTAIPHLNIVFEVQLTSYIYATYIRNVYVLRSTIYRDPLFNNPIYVACQLVILGVSRFRMQHTDSCLFLLFFRYLWQL